MAVEEVVDCPSCGEPAQHVVSVHPGGGGSFKVECASCGYSYSDNY